MFGGVWRGCDDAQGAVSEGEARPAALRQGPPLCPPEEEATVECALPGLVSAGPLGLLLLEQGKLVSAAHWVYSYWSKVSLCLRAHWVYSYWSKVSLCLRPTGSTPTGTR